MAKRTKRADLATLLARPTISPDELHESNALKVGRNGIYEACHNGELEVIRRGKKILILTAPLRRKLGIEADINDKRPRVGRRGR